jgi:hypothetical protein
MVAGKGVCVAFRCRKHKWIMSDYCPRHFKMADMGKRFLHKGEDFKKRLKPPSEAERVRCYHA